MREMLVAPVRRGALVVGKCLGGATVATIQGGIMLVLAGLVHVPYSPALIGALILEMALAALALTAIGTLIASRIARIESFQVVIQFLVLPMFFLSGALFPLTNLPRWLEPLTMLDPLSYAVDPMRREVFSHLTVSPALTRTLDPGISWGRLEAADPARARPGGRPGGDRAGVRRPALLADRIGGSHPTTGMSP